MEKTLYRKFVATASDCTADTPHLRADCYADGQAQKLGLAMLLTTSLPNCRGVVVPRKDAMGEPVTLTIREAFVDEQGHEYTRDGIIENPNAHNFTLQTKGYLAVKEGDEPKAPKIFAPLFAKVAGKEKWILTPTSTKAIAAKADASADELEARAKELRAKSAAEKVKDKLAKAAAEKAQRDREEEEDRLAQEADEKAEAERIAAEAEAKKKVVSK